MGRERGAAWREGGCPGASRLLMTCDSAFPATEVPQRAKRRLPSPRDARGLTCSIAQVRGCGVGELSGRFIVLRRDELVEFSGMGDARRQLRPRHGELLPCSPQLLAQAAMDLGSLVQLN